MKALFILFFMLFSTATWAQNGSLAINADPRLNNIIAKRSEQNRYKPAIMGFRVQFYLGDNREEAIRTKDTYNAVFPDVPTYIIYQSPYFKVRAGNFTTRVEATKYIANLPTGIGTAFIVEDEIVP